MRDFGEDERRVRRHRLIDGPSLRDVLASGRAAVAAARRLILQMTDAAEALHAHGGLLTGVNPDMIRVTGDGGATARADDRRHPRAADVLATMREQQLRGQEASEQELPYLAPEVLTGRPPEPRADLFTVGVAGRIRW